MKKLITFVCLLAIVALPAGVLGAPGNQPKKGEQVGGNKGKKEKQEKSVPEPSTILLLGAGAAAFAGLRKRLRPKDLP